MGWPQITYIVLSALGLGIAMEQHGRPKTGNHSFFTTAVGMAIIGWLLYAGGFFS